MSYNLARTSDTHDVTCDVCSVTETEEEVRPGILVGPADWHQVYILDPTDFSSGGWVDICPQCIDEARVISLFRAPRRKESPVVINGTLRVNQEKGLNQ